MPHRKNAKADIGTAKMFSDSYDADNIYLSEEGWVYRHFKNTAKTRWCDEILVAGQVVPNMTIHGVSNGFVSETNPAKLGTDDTVTYQVGDGKFDFEYSGHFDDYAPEVIETDPKPTGFGKVAWPAINVSGESEGDISTQIPAGWNINSSEGQTDPSDVVTYPNEPPYPVSGTVLPNQYNVSSKYEDPLTGVVVGTPEPGYEYKDGAQDPQGVIIGVQDETKIYSYTEEQNPTSTTP